MTTNNTPPPLEHGRTRRLSATVEERRAEHRQSQMRLELLRVQSNRMLMDVPSARQRSSPSRGESSAEDASSGGSQGGVPPRSPSSPHPPTLAASPAMAAAPLGLPPRSPASPAFPASPATPTGLSSRFLASIEGLSVTAASRPTSHGREALVPAASRRASLHAPGRAWSAVDVPAAALRRRASVAEDAPSRSPSMDQARAVLSGPPFTPPLEDDDEEAATAVRAGRDVGRSAGDLYAPPPRRTHRLYHSAPLSEMSFDSPPAVKKMRVSIVMHKDLPTHLYEGGAGGARGCVICMEDFMLRRTVVKTLPCEHQFCSLCLDRWLVERPRCPICNYKVLQPM